MMFPKKRWGWKTDNTKPYNDRKRLVSVLDRWFSKYIRLRDSDRNGLCRCVTCGVTHHWKDIDCGHFVSREKIATRFDERNCHAQCKQCNRFKSGNQFEHGKAIDRIHGSGTADMLNVIGKVRGVKVDHLWLESKIVEYKEKVKHLLTP